jgi:single-strand DNA-binding protein
VSDNALTVVGNLTRDPELRFLNNGSASLNLSIAVNRRWQNRQTQEWEERVSYFGVVVYGAMAENAANSLSKGNRVVVSGRIEQRGWDAENGEKKSIVEIHAEEIAPSLKFATTVVTRTPRAEPGRPVDPPSRTLEPRSYAFDEEPF